MKFTVERRSLVKLLQLIATKSLGSGKTDPEIKLFACAARVFVATSGMVAGNEALVFKEGECFIPGTQLLLLLKTRKAGKNVTMEIDHDGLRIGNLSIPVRAYSPVTYPPGHFQVFPVTDLDVLGAQEKPPAVTEKRWSYGPDDEPPPAEIPEWHSDSDSDVETARIWQLQLTFFQRQPRELCEQLRLPWTIACKLYDDGFLSFDPRPCHVLNEAQEAEFLFVGSIAAAGYDPIRLARILHGLKWPYQYRPGRLYLDWVVRSWRLLPVIKKPHPESIFNDWLADLESEQDISKLEELVETTTSALKSAQKQNDKV
jgi:hypothetical protein